MPEVTDSVPPTGNGSNGEWLDWVRPFLIVAPGVRGRMVRLGPSLQTILDQHAYPAPVAGLVAETLVLAALLSSALKYDGVFTLQAKGDGAVSLLVADVTAEGAVRGYAQFDADAVAAASQDSGGAPSLPRLLGGGYLAFTVDPGEESERYQGIVELNGATLAECVHHYFNQSEQLNAGLHVAADATADENGVLAWTAGGIMIQRLPEEAGAAPEAADEHDDGWRRSMALLASCRPGELVDRTLAPDTLLYRLFHEDGVAVFEPRHLFFRCRCSAERLETVLRQMDREELSDLAVDGAIEATCEFCSHTYRFPLDKLG